MKEEEDDVKRLKADMRRGFIFLAAGYEKEVDLIEEGLSLTYNSKSKAWFILLPDPVSIKIKTAYYLSTLTLILSLRLRG